MKMFANFMFLVMATAALTACNNGICADDDCICESGDNCEFECVVGDCRQQCEADADCTATCEGGGCSQQCAPGATCDFSCAGGNCTQQCAGSTSCTLSCGEDCTTDSGLGDLNNFDF